jgi:hypothetical protein
VTEQQWQTCANPKPMLKSLRGKASDRKLRLLACACCRRVWGLLSPEESRHAVLVAERFADGLASADELTTAGHHATRPAKDAAARRLSTFPGAAGKAAAALVGSEAYSRVYEAHGEQLRDDAPQQAARELGLSAAAAQDPRDAYLEAEAHEAAEQAALLRDLVGNPFRPVSLAPAWLTPAVLKLAQAGYDNRLLPSGLLDNGGLAILADALEEAGCDNADILSHLRGPGPHVRGCWLLDLLLAKE